MATSITELLRETAQPLPRTLRKATGNKTVTLVWSGRTPQGWKRFTVKIAANGKPKNHPHAEFTQGHWELRRYEGTKLKYDRLPEMGIQDALLQRRQLESTLIENHGVLPESEPDKLTMKQLFEDYREMKILEGVGKDSKDGIRHTIDEFLHSSNRRYPEGVTTLDVLKYCEWLTTPKPAGRGLADHTRSGRFGYLCALLKHSSGDIKKLLSKQQRKVLSAYPELQPEIYETEDILALLDVCDDYHKVVYYFLWKTGFRKEEAMFLEWADVNFSAGTLAVRMKSYIGFEPKKCKERIIPLDPDLACVLNQWRKKNPSTRFVMGNSKDKPNTHWWDDLKEIAAKNGLRCGSCERCTAPIDKSGCEKWFLHKFRATYCTERFVEGESFIEVQLLLGHSSKDTKSLYRYMNLAKIRSALHERMKGGAR